MKIGTNHLIALYCPRGNYGIQKFEEGEPKCRQLVKSTNTHIRQKMKQEMLAELRAIE